MVALILAVCTWIRKPCAAAALVVEEPRGAVKNSSLHTAICMNPGVAGFCLRVWHVNAPRFPALLAL